VADVHITTKITQVFADGELMTLARYPNNGFMKVTSDKSTRMLSADNLNQPAEHWTGATLIIRKRRWTC